MASRWDQSNEFDIDIDADIDADADIDIKALCLAHIVR